MSVIGTDGISPSYMPEAPWNIWEISQVYNGGPGANMYVPKLNDYVIDAPSGTLYIVTNLNLDTYIPTLQQIEIAKLPPILKYQNQVTNVIYPESVSSYRLYFNSQTDPYTINVDASLILYNTNASTFQLFLGNDILNAEPLGIFLNNNQQINNTNIPLITNYFNNSSNTYVKQFPTFYTNQLLQTGQLVTLLVYNGAGQVCSRQVLMVEDSTAYPTQSQGQKLVTGLSLESSFVSQTQNNSIEIPSNIGIQNVLFKGIVEYNDGTSTIHNINSGGSFNVYGLDQILKSNILGSVPVVLQYTLQPDEVAIDNVSYNGTTVSVEYNIILTEPNYDYQLQLYPIPFWTGSSYVIKWILMSMSRNLFLDVSNYVTYSNGSGFNGTLYNSNQLMNVGLNLSVLNKPDINLNQNCQINLGNISQGPSTIYQIWTNLNTSTVPYGNNVRAKSLVNGNNLIDITCQNYTLSNWLNQVFYANLPLFNSNIENSPPQPTHFDIIYAAGAVNNTSTNSSGSSSSTSSTTTSGTNSLSSNPIYNYSVNDAVNSVGLIDMSGTTQNLMLGSSNIASEEFLFLNNFPTRMYNIEEWNTSLKITENTLPLYTTLLIRFFYVTGNTKSIIGVSPMPLTQY